MNNGKGLSAVRGFRFSAVAAGIRYENRLDLSLIAADSDCVAAGAFTTNKICAAPVKLSRQRINNTIRGIVINSTNANACTGEEGLRNAEIITQSVAEALGISPSSVLAASTGIIGVQLPREKIISAIPQLVSSLSHENGHLVARAIMTTDTVPKETSKRFHTSRGEFTIAGIAKGAGMIAPNMATLLAFLLTDAPVAKKDLDEIFYRNVDKTFNAITIDGDMSTNDTAIILSPAFEQTLPQNDLANFEEALHAVLSELSEKIIKDAEGATKLARIRVIGARTGEDAQKIARAVANSLLVKTALFGMDPNWGRIACAAGYSGAEIDEKHLSIYFENLCVLRNGVPQNVPRDDIQKAMSGPEVLILIDVGLGKGEFQFLTSDISYEYVKINAEYST
ncbi:MAG: bifunctional glutamate N-acetyltransferase/amino-acid acetyltransferase ArgJ [Spirochaetes bacterium]|nr:bifunctional glutamate N-acetyltransferase/amino-acid acetyltransferase ArgJ [Spirochaetota bacterium]